ncbi:hypothetical protein [Methanobrevibacter sp.]|uniref:hypothetical protein n=1 Tax=Methanobrevibacter sp. TaxID=66852 RepID=UPI00386BFF95
MENKNLIIIAVAIVLIVVVVGVILTTGVLNKADDRTTTSFSNSFMEGAFTGDVKLVKNASDYMQSYEDSQHSITYNISTVDNSTALMDIYYVQGVTNPEHRSFNGNDWNIYFSQAIQGNDTNNKVNIIICQSQGEKQGYLIYMIIDSKTDLNVSLNVFGEPYKSYVEPLLKSITLKESSNVPAINDQFGLSESDFAKQMDLVHQYKSGNTSVLQGS